MFEHFSKKYIKHFPFLCIWGSTQFHHICHRHHRCCCCGGGDGGRGCGYSKTIGNAQCLTCRLYQVVVICQCDNLQLSYLANANAVVLLKSRTFFFSSYDFFFHTYRKEYAPAVISLVHLSYRCSGGTF